MAEKTFSYPNVTLYCEGPAKAIADLERHLSIDEKTGALNSPVSANCMVQFRVNGSFVSKTGPLSIRNNSSVKEANRIITDAGLFLEPGSGRHTEDSPQATAHTGSTQTNTGGLSAAEIILRNAVVTKKPGTSETPEAPESSKPSNHNQIDI